MSVAEAAPSAAQMKSLRRQMEDQLAALSRQMGDLEALSTALLVAPGHHETKLDSIQKAIRELNAQRLLLSATYLQHGARVQDVEALVTTLECITGEMLEEAERMEDTAEAIRTSGRLVAKGGKAIEALARASGGH